MLERLLLPEKHAISILMKDHDTVKELFDRFEKSESVAEKEKLIPDALSELKIHAVIEEEIFYPAVRKHVDKDLMNEADEEHHVARILIVELDRSGRANDHRYAKFTVLIDPGDGGWGRSMSVIALLLRGDLNNGRPLDAGSNRLWRRGNKPFTHIEASLPLVQLQSDCRLKTRGFLSRSSTQCHLNSIGWADSPAVENRLRPSALPLLSGAATPSQQNFLATQETMKNTKFLVKVVRGTRAAEYVQRIDRTPVQTTLKRNLALVMGKLTAEDVVNSLGNSRCVPELVPVQV